MTADVALRGDAQIRADDIRSRLASLTANLNEIPALIQQAHEAGDWQALGYEDWPAYVRGEYGTHLVKLNKAVRRQWTQDLKAVGMTVREIAPVTNVSKATVARDAVSSETAHDSAPDDGIIDGEVLSDPAEPSKELHKLRTMVDRAHTGIGYLTKNGELPGDLTREQAQAWHDLIVGKRGKGNAGLVTLLRDFAGKLSEAYSLK